MSNFSGEILWCDGALWIRGDVQADDAADLAAMLHQVSGAGVSLDVHLDELELEDGVSVVQAINGVRGLLRRWDTLILIEAPQMLAHTLYKIGMLQDGRVQLVDPRDEDGTTAN